MMTIHPAPHPIIASKPLTEAQASAKELLFFGLVNRGFWLARRGMLPSASRSPTHGSGPGRRLRRGPGHPSGGVGLTPANEDGGQDALR